MGKNSAELPNFYPSYLGIPLIISLDLHTPLPRNHLSTDFAASCLTSSAEQAVITCFEYPVTLAGVCFQAFCQEFTAIAPCNICITFTFHPYLIGFAHKPHH
ncbi:hypothetical protein [Nostoc sp. UIC 10630]|uniref:hypothetical protein n=1 Tax=Nostoc sp. UIC 10630 TaxID=2100146 RepID=UPI0013D2CF71|nr:hypothetical protein [Nostoc sp. UIC 10630]NEU83648.1 hypothetical protein [Nostoc sp. UIC 10630]